MRHAPRIEATSTLYLPFTSYYTCQQSLRGFLYAFDCQLPVSDGCLYAVASRVNTNVPVEPVLPGMSSYDGSLQYHEHII